MTSNEVALTICEIGRLHLVFYTIHDAVSLPLSLPEWALIHLRIFSNIWGQPLINVALFILLFFMIWHRAHFYIHQTFNPRWTKTKKNKSMIKRPLDFKTVKPKDRIIWRGLSIAWHSLSHLSTNSTPNDKKAFKWASQAGLYNLYAVYSLVKS